MTKALLDLFVRLDMALTGKPEDQVRPTHARQAARFADPVDFAANQPDVYLSDGGYSRVLWSWEDRFGADGGLGLSGVSRDAVKERWRSDPDVRRLVEEIQDVVRAAIRRYEASDPPDVTLPQGPR